MQVKSDMQDQIATMQETRSLNEARGLQGKVCKPCVDVVKHAARGVYLSRNLGNHGGHEKHGKTRLQKDFLYPLNSQGKRRMISLTGIKADINILCILTL